MVFKVTLEPWEIRLAAQVGVERQIHNLTTNATSGHGLDKKVYDWQIHIEDCLAEYAVAKFYNLRWTAGTGYGNVDVADFYEVRSISGPDKPMIVKPSDNSLYPIICVYGYNGKYRLLGWQWIGEVKDLYKLERYGGRPPCYHVPQAELRPMETLSVMMVATGRTETIDEL